MAKRLMFNQLSDHAQAVFENEDNYEGFRNLSFDLANKAEIVDEDGKVLSKIAAESIHRNFAHEILGIDKNSTKRDRKRAMKKYGDEFFAITEEVIDIKVETGFKESEFFNTFVENRNIARGDSQEFWTEEKVYLSVARTSGDHHDVNLVASV